MTSAFSFQHYPPYHAGQQGVSLHSRSLVMETARGFCLLSSYQHPVRLISVQTVISQPTPPGLARNPYHGFCAMCGARNAVFLGRSLRDHLPLHLFTSPLVHFVPRVSWRFPLRAHFTGARTVTETVVGHPALFIAGIPAANPKAPRSIFKCEG
jgi:hypothetical protein